MAYRRSITTRAKLLYQHHQKLAPSFSQFHHHDDEDSKINPHAPYTTQSFIHGSGIYANSCNSSNGLKAPFCRGARFGDLSRVLSPMSCGHVFFSSRNMSTTNTASTGDGIAEAAGKIEYMADMADVLTDKTVEAVASQAQVVNEVAVAAADSFPPVAALQYVIDYVHTFTGFNWWSSIIATTILIRLVTLPLMINQLRSTSKFTLLRPRLEEVKQDMDNRGMSPVAVAEGQQRMKELFKEYGVTPFTPLKGLFIQGPIFISFFLAVTNMTEKIPSFKQGGAYWFTDLTTPDSMYILPVLTALTFWITVECNMQEGMEGNPAAKTIKNVSRVFAALTVPFTAGFAKGIFCYWITSNIFSLMYGTFIKNHQVKKFLNIPIIEVAPPPPSSNGTPQYSFFEALKKYQAAQQQHLASSTAESSKLSDTQQQCESSPTEVSKRGNGSTLRQKLQSLEKEVKGRKKGKRR